jgi:hypothetical protein
VEAAGGVEAGDRGVHGDLDALVVVVGPLGADVLGADLEGFDLGGRGEGPGGFTRAPHADPLAAGGVADLAELDGALVVDDTHALKDR